MIFIQLLPVVLSFLLIGAHFFRYGQIFLVVLSLLPLGLLFVKRTWSMRTIQILLIAASCEWLRTLFLLVRSRQQMGLDWQRLAIILGSIALFTLLSALAFRCKKLGSRYR